MDSLLSDQTMPSWTLPLVRGIVHHAIDYWNSVTSARMLSAIAGFLIAHRIARIIYNVWFHELSKFPGPTHMAASYIPYQYLNMVSGKMHEKIEELHSKYGPAVRVGPDHLALDGSIAWPEVFGSKKDRGDFGKVENYLFENDTLGIIAAPNELHRRQRRQLSHAFSDSALRDQEAVINKYLDLLMQRLTEKSASNESFNIVDWMNFLTFDIIGHLTYSESFHCLDKENYHPWVLQFFDGVRGESYRRFFSAFPFVKEIVTALSLNNSMKKGSDHKLYIIEKATERMGKGEHAVKGYSDFMTYMLSKNSDGVFGFTEEEVLATMPLIIGAGSETTAATMSALIFYLGTHPDVYEKLIDEIRSTFAQEGDITLKSTQQLKYLHACLEETLRIYPPVNETPPRRCPGAMIDKRYVPPETRISVYQGATYRNSRHWADPDSYTPERWLPESHPLYNPKFKEDKHEVFKPFSFGPRDCLGKNLAYSELRMITSRLLYRFDIKLAQGQENWHVSQRTFLVWERGPLIVSLTSRLNT